MYPDLQGKVVLITGAAGALGQSVVRYFHAVGASLVLVDRSKDSFARAFGDALHPDWLLSETDITRNDSIQVLMQTVREQYGRLDVLVNVAGGYSGGKSILDTGEETWDFMMTLNAKSVFLMSAEASRLMIDAGNGGRIISIGAKPALKGTKNHTAYSASKSAVLRLTESMAAELNPHKITVNAVLPSTLDTPANRQSMPNANHAEWVTPDSLAGVIGFLASDAARDISGAAIPVYGGSLA